MSLVSLPCAGPLSFHLADADSPELVIAFASIGHDPTRAPSPEFVATASGRGGRPKRALFVQDSARSWGNGAHFAPALQQIYRDLQAARPVERLATLGLSMGGYSAMVAAHILPVQVVLAFGPQADLDLPHETRWRPWITQIDQPSWPHMPAPPAGCQAYVMHGMQDDGPQAAAIPLAKGLDHLLFSAQSHASLVPHLKAQGLLSGLLEAALEGDRRRLLRLTSRAGGQRRRTQAVTATE